MSDSVSRETPPAPQVASGVFSHHLPKAQEYADLLVREGVVRGLIGPREVPRLWERHLVNCALLGEAIPEGAHVCDVGSGAGLPGLVLAIRRPDLHITLVEPLLRRATFLGEAVEALELGRVEVRRARAEELHGLIEFDVVTARAVAPLERLLRWTMPLVRQHGELVAMKGSTAAEEVERARRTVQRFGGGGVRVEQYGLGLVDQPTTVVRVRAEAPSRLRWDERRPQALGRNRRAAARRGKER